MKPFVVAITGASGSVYGIRLLQVLTELGQPVIFSISDHAKEVLAHENDFVWNESEPEESLRSWVGDKVCQITYVDSKDIAAPIASGSFPTAGMIIAPCSMGTLGAIAQGICQNVIHRAADCTLKETRKLVLVPRETPLNAIHLENMLKLARIGVTILPAMPAYYSGVSKISDMIDFVVGKILDQWGLVHALYPRWTGTTEAFN